MQTVMKTVMKTAWYRVTLVLSLFGTLALFGCSKSAAPATAEARAVTTPSGSYFYFSSGYEAGTVLTTTKAKTALANYATVVAGIDAGGNTASAEFLARVKKLRAQGWRVHVYLEGPGGPTGSSWSTDECQRVHAAAKIYVKALIPSNDTCNNDRAAWMQEWNSTGFFKQLQRQLADLQPLGVDSVEVDNLYRAGYGPYEDKPLSDFIVRFNAGKASNNPIRLLLKNIGSPAELSAVMAASPRTAIANYMIVEEDLRSQWCALRAASKKYGITTALSWNTSNYHAETDDIALGKDLVLAGPAKTARKAFTCPTR